MQTLPPLLTAIIPFPSLFLLLPLRLSRSRSHSSLLLLLPPVSSTRTLGSGSNSIQHAAKINERQKETERGGLRERNKAKWRGNTLSCFAILSTSILKHTNRQKLQNTPPTHLHFYHFAVFLVI